jgi:hypothetical protein
MPNPTPTQAVRQARLVAFALIAGQVIFLAIAAVLVSNAAGGRATADGTPAGGAPADPSQTLFAVALFLFAVLVAIAFLLRRRLLTPDGDGTVAPDLYLKGQIVFFALCEMPTLMFLVVALVQQELLPAAPVAVLSIAVQALNLPKADDLPGA